MASIYDNIKTAKGLVELVSIHGLSTEVEDICRAQDIFGRATIEELDELANDIGRNNDKGEPDPKGTWSSGRKGTQSVFYSILYHIWSWEEATRFYNQHTNPEYIELKSLREEAKLLESTVERLTARRDELLAEEKEAANMLVQEMNKTSEATARAEKAEEEIVRLKAKLYDLMIAKGEK